MSWSRLSKVSLLGLSSGLGVGLGTSIYLNKEQLAKRHQVFNSWTTNTIVPECAVWDNNWDKRAPFSLVKPLKADASPEEENNYNAKIEKHKPTATRHLILIRHGQYNLAGATDPERILTELGRAQAKHTGERLTELKIPIDHVVISTMARAQETGKIILKCTQLSHLSLENDPLIEEGAPVAPEPPVGHWRPEPSFFQDGGRIEAAFRNHFHRAEPSQKTDSYTLMVCHANVIRYFVCRALQFPAEAWLRISLHHASITWLTIHPNGRVILRLLGDSGHMPLNYLTTK